MKKIFLDMDGVIVDFMKGAHEFHNLPYSYGDFPYPVNEWYFVHHTGMSNNEFWSPLGEAFWEGLDWTPDGLEIFHMLQDATHLENMAILTAPVLNAGCSAGKMTWVRNNIPALKRRVIVTNAKEMCAHPDALLIDDADKNVNLWRANGGVAILVPRKWNSRHAESENTVEILRKEIRDAGIGSVL